MNAPTVYLNFLAAFMRASENPDHSTTEEYLSGGNAPASNAPGIGIAIGNGALPAETVPPHTMNWTLEDQFEAARTPQVSQSIGETGFVTRTGNVATTWDSSQALYTPNGAASSGGASGNAAPTYSYINDISNPDNDATTLTPVPGAVPTFDGEASLVTLAAGWVSTAIP